MSYYMKAAINYKALYRQCINEHAAKDSLIALLQQQLSWLADERQTFTRIIAGSREQMALQATQISTQQIILEQQHLTIAGQGEKLSQQQTIIHEQNTLITTQQKTLTNNKHELLRLANLGYELIALKKWIFGRKSEKRHQPTDTPKAVAGDQLVLAMEVDGWGVCTIKDRHKVPAQLRTIKSTTPGKPGGRHDFPAGLQEEITILDVPDRPSGARCVGYVDQRQLACDAMRWYI